MTYCSDATIRPQPARFGIFAKFAQRLKVRSKRRSQRALMRSMMDLSPEVLKDIGVSRGDISWAASLPIEKDALKELECVAHRGATNR